MNEGWRVYRPWVIGAIAVVLAFWWGKGYGEDRRPDQRVCEDYVTALYVSAHAFKDVAFALADPEGYADPLDRTPRERAQTGEERLRYAEDLEGCSIRPRKPVGPFG